MICYSECVRIDSWSMNLKCFVFTEFTFPFQVFLLSVFIWVSRCTIIKYAPSLLCFVFLWNQLSQLVKWHTSCPRTADKTQHAWDLRWKNDFVECHSRRFEPFLSFWRYWWPLSSLAIYSALLTSASLFVSLTPVTRRIKKKKKGEENNSTNKRQTEKWYSLSILLVDCANFIKCLPSRL